MCAIMQLKQFHSSHPRSEEDARTSWCPCVNPTLHKVGWIAGRRRLPRRAQVLVIQHYNRELGAGNSCTNTSSLKHETVRSADQCRVPRVTHRKATCAHGTRTSCAHRDTAPKAQQMQTNQGTGGARPKSPTTPSLAIPLSTNTTLQTQKNLCVLCALSDLCDSEKP